MVRERKIFAPARSRHGDEFIAPWDFMHQAVVALIEKAIPPRPLPDQALSG